MTALLRTTAITSYFHHSGQFYYILTDIRGNCLYINTLFLQLQELTERDTPQYLFEDFITPDQRPEYNRIIQHMIPPTATTFETDHPLPDHTTRRIKWEAQVLLDENDVNDAIQYIGVEEKNHTATGPVSELDINDLERYKAYELGAEGVWRLDLEIPAPIDWSVAKLIDHCAKHAYLADCNDNMARMYGLTERKEMMGMKLESMMKMDDPKQLAYFESFIKNGFKISNAETQEHDINGNKLYFLNSMAGIIENGLLKRVWGTQQDITQKKKAEEQQLRSELFYKNLIGESLDGILLTDTKGVITFASLSVERILGFRPEDLVGTNMFVYTHPEDQPLALGAFEDEVRMEPQTKFIDIRLKKKTEEWVWCSVRGHNMLYNPYVGRMVIYFQDNTQRKKTEQALKESESRFRNQAILLDNVTDIIVTADLQHTITFWNTIAEQTTGIPASEAVGRNYRDVIPLDYSPYTREEVATTLAKDGIWRGESSFVDKTGRKQVHLHTFSVIHDEQGNNKGVLVVGKDITERKEMESRLQASESFYRNLTAYSLDGIILVNFSGKITYGSPSIVKLSGYRVEELLGKQMMDFVHPEDLPIAQEGFIRELNKESEVNYLLLRMKHSNGNWVWCTVRAHNMLDDPDFNSMIIYFNDDSKRKNIEDKLRESEQRFRHLIDNLSTGVVLQDTRSAMLVCNKAAAELLGVTEDQLLGKTSFDPRWNVIRENGTNFPGDEHPVPQAIRTKKAVTEVVMGVYRPLKNDRVWLLVNAEPILDKNNDIIHIICSFADITEQRRLSKELIDQQIQKQRQLVQATIDGQEKERKEIGKELHDNINQHLTTTRLYLEIARDKADGQVREMIGNAHRELTDIFKEIRKLSQSLVPPTLGDLGLVESVQDICDSLKRTHQFIVEFHHPLFDEDVLPDNMKLMLFRIIQEQVNNIVRHASADHIQLTLSSDDVKLVMTITDNGKGFDTAGMHKGLGLTNIKNRAELFNGQADIRSEPGSGCILTVSVPLK